MPVKKSAASKVIRNRKVAETSKPVKKAHLDVTTVVNENVSCPFCGQVVLNLEEGDFPCKHTVFIYSWDAGDFGCATAAVRHWWEKHGEQAGEEGGSHHPDDLATCPYV